MPATQQNGGMDSGTLTTKKNRSGKIILKRFLVIRCVAKLQKGASFLRENNYPAFIAYILAFSKDVDVVNRIAIFVVEIAQQTGIDGSIDMIHRFAMNACGATDAIV